MGFYRSSVVVAAAVLAGGLATGCAALNDRGYVPKYVNRATADDCAVIVAVAKAMIGPDPKTLPISPAHQLDDGGEFKETCPWKALGVPRPSSPRSGEQSFIIYKPAYRPPGDTAEVTVDIIGPPQRGRRPQLTGYAACQLKRTGGAWAVERCGRSGRRE